MRLPDASAPELRAQVEAVLQDRDLLQKGHARAVREVVYRLDRGDLRVAERIDGPERWIVHGWIQQSISLYFGIAPLEAMSHDVPVIISKQSGVAEVLTHALKVDFWDINEMANKIIAVLRHPPLSQTLRQHGSFEVRRLSWTDAARSCVQVYEDAVRAMNGK